MIISRDGDGLTTSKEGEPDEEDDEEEGANKYAEDAASHSNSHKGQTDLESHSGLGATLI